MASEKVSTGAVYLSRRRTSKGEFINASHSEHDGRNVKGLGAYTNHATALLGALQAMGYPVSPEWIEEAEAWALSDYGSSSSAS